MCKAGPQTLLYLFKIECMGVWEQAQADLAKFTSNTTSGPAKTCQFTSPAGDVVSIALVPTKHHLGQNEDGKNVNAKKASICFSEQLLTALSYPVRNSSNEVDLKGHQVKVKDSTGLLCSYMIREWYPDEALGLVTCILGDFE